MDTCYELMTPKKNTACTHSSEQVLRAAFLLTDVHHTQVMCVVFSVAFKQHIFWNYLWNCLNVWNAWHCRNYS